MEEIEYNLAIKCHRESIRLLEEQRQKQKELTFPKIDGKCFKVAYKTYVKVRGVEKVWEDNEINVDCIYIRISQDETEACIDTETSYSVYLRSEVPKEEFDLAFDRAIKIIGDRLRESAGEKQQ